MIIVLKLINKILTCIKLSNRSGSDKLLKSKAQSFEKGLYKSGLVLRNVFKYLLILILLINITS